MNEISSPTKCIFSPTKCIFSPTKCIFSPTKCSLVRQIVIWGGLAIVAMRQLPRGIFLENLGLF
jgi:hypothetical protein